MRNNTIAGSSLELQDDLRGLAQRVADARQRFREGGERATVFVEVTPKPKGNGREIFYPFEKGKKPRKCSGCNRPLGRAIVRETLEVKNAEKAATQLAHLLFPGRPLTGPVLTDITTVLRIPTSWPKWEREAAEAIRRWPINANSGDRGNYAKMVEDVLEGAGYIANDAQLVTGVVEKVYGRRPGYLINMRELDWIEDVQAWRLESNA